MQMRRYKHPAEDTIDAICELYVAQRDVSHLAKRFGLLDPSEPISSAGEITATGIASCLEGSGRPNSE